METEDLIGNLKSNLNKIKVELSAARKKGINAGIAELMLMNIPSKIQMAEITMDKKDINKVMELLNSAKKELDEASKEKF